MSTDDRQTPTVGTPGTPSATGAFRLPPRLLDKVARRICWLSLFLATLVVTVQIGHFVAQPELAAILRSPLNLSVTGFTIAMALALFGLSRYRAVAPQTLLGLGMLFEVVVAFTISLVETAVPIQPGQPRVGMSTLGPWIVAVGVLIPNRPVWTLIVALSAATMWPLAYLINDSRFGFENVPTGQLLIWPIMNYLLAILAYYIGHMIYGTSIAAQTAQDLGSYRLVSPIGRGGMGEVWRATHQMLARHAAIKLVKTDLSGQSARQVDLSIRRFKREANIIASLQSPHTVYLYDFGVAEGGGFYYVMELLDGISLQDLVTTFGPQPANRVVWLLRQVCESLEEAHRQGLVHRDLKPSNIMVCKVALEHDFVKVLDFGLAKFVDHSDSSQLTREGVTAGTPGYIAPEVALGDASIDGRADLYALGCVGYFLLTGSLVFPDTNPMSMALKHVQAIPEPPSSRTELFVPESLDRVVMQCLEKRATDRPASAAAVAAMLAACDATWSTDEAEDWWSRHLPPTSTLRVGAQTPSPQTPAVVQKVHAH